MKSKLKKSNLGIKAIIAVFVFTLAAFPSEAKAAEISGVEFDNQVEIEDVTMDLKGVGKKSVIFLKAFVAGFYTVGQADTDALGTFPKHLEVQYFVKIPAKKLNNYTVERMKANITRAEFDSLEKEVEMMEQYFVDLKPGDRFSLTYIPQVGTRFAYNGEATGVIKGENFAKALFAVWIGKEPFDKKLKEQILGLETAGEANDSLVLVK